MRKTALDPVNGFTAQASVATVIEVASHLDIPLSTAHRTTLAALGVSATRRLSAVR